MTENNYNFGEYIDSKLKYIYIISNIPINKNSKTMNKEYFRLIYPKSNIDLIDIIIHDGDFLIKESRSNFGTPKWLVLPKTKAIYKIKKVDEKMKKLNTLSFNQITSLKTL